MRQLKEIYGKTDLNLSGKILYREAVRGIIWNENKLLMVYSSKVGDYKFPGGGVDIGESYEEALIREVREECGAKVINIYAEFGKTVEYDRPMEKEYDVFKMISYYYLCNVDSVFEEQLLDDYEENLGFEPVWIDIDSAIEANRALIDSQTGNLQRWIKRELCVLELLKRELGDCLGIC